jgi:hypothetical protein
LPLLSPFSLAYYLTLSALSTQYNPISSHVKTCSIQPPFDALLLSLTSFSVGK